MSKYGTMLDFNISNILRNNKDKEVLKTIKHDVECLVIDRNQDDNRYHYDLAIENLSNLIDDE